MRRLMLRADTASPSGQAANSKAGPDLVIPATLMAAIALILPPLQTQAWWLILPCLICLILRWHTVAFVLLFAAITYADSWWTGGYFLGLTVLLMMRMHSNPAAGNLAQIGNALRQLVLAAPILIIILALMLAAGARWSSRDAGNRAATGISETMTPGTVSELVNDGDLAMRVRFSDDPEPLSVQDLYWRGIVMEDFDGRTWSRHNRLEFDLDPIPSDVNTQDRLSYLVTLEPNRQFWLYGLHQAYAMRSQTFRDSRGMLITSDMVRQRVRYPVTSIPPPTDLSLSEDSRQRNLAIPADSNPQTRQWVTDLRRNISDDRAFAQAVLQHFNQQDFFYTLTPELSSHHSVDDLMFNNREGYCEHYASALTFILRAAGIPARVVAGYQGGEFNPITGHWTVYQYNAHAWVDTWFPDSGWQRLDPTAVIAPERIQSGIDAWLAALNSDARSQLDRDTRLRLQLAAIPGYQSARSTLGALQYGWNLSMYDNEGALRTEDLSDWLDGQGLGNLPVWLLALLLVAVGARAMWSGRRDRQALSPAMRAYLRLDAALRKRGLGRKAGETIAVHLKRVGEALPEDEQRWQAMSRTLTEAEYGGAATFGAEIRAEIRELLRKTRRYGHLAD
jgi:protein-glutamine gamma-glutamyltransferase